MEAEKGQLLERHGGESEKYGGWKRCRAAAGARASGHSDQVDATLKATSTGSSADHARAGRTSKR